MGRLNMETTQYTLEATMQLVNSVEAESRVMPRRHLKCRLPCLRPKRLSEGFSSDTFFPNERSARGYPCAQVFVGTRRGFTYVVPLKNKAYAYTALQDFIRQVGPPPLHHSRCSKRGEPRGVALCMPYVLYITAYVRAKLSESEQGKETHSGY
jgi:hypothetical protein